MFLLHRPDVRHQLHGLVVVAVPDGRVHQLRQLQHLQQLGVLGERGRVEAAARVDLAAAPAELGTARGELGQLGQQVVQPLLHRRELGTTGTSTVNWGPRGVNRELGKQGHELRL